MLRTNYTSPYQSGRIQAQVMKRLLVQGGAVDIENNAGITCVQVANMYNMAVPVDMLEPCNFVSNSSAEVDDGL